MVKFLKSHLKVKIGKLLLIKG